MAEPSPSFNPNPRVPRLKLLKGATDTHFHVFGPQKRRALLVDNPQRFYGFTS